MRETSYGIYVVVAYYISSPKSPTLPYFLRCHVLVYIFRHVLIAYMSTQMVLNLPFTLALLSFIPKHSPSIPPPLVQCSNARTIHMQSSSPSHTSPASPPHISLFILLLSPRYLYYLPSPYHSGYYYMKYRTGCSAFPSV